MQPFIDAAASAVHTIYDDILKNGNWSRTSVRLGLVAFRDHPPQDKTLLYKVFDFTSDMGTMNDNFNSLKAEGGGDFPEAHCEAIAQTLQADWDDNHIKIAVLITDSSPHGIGEPGDKLPDGCPDRTYTSGNNEAKPNSRFRK